MPKNVQLLEPYPPHNAGETVSLANAVAAVLIAAGRAIESPTSVEVMTLEQGPDLSDVPISERALHLPPASDDPQWSEGTGATMVPVQPDADGTTRFAGEPAQDE